MQGASVDNNRFDSIYPQLVYFKYRNADSQWRIDPRTIDFHDISYVVDGEAEYTIGDQTFLVKKGDLLYVPPSTFRQAALTPLDTFELYAMNIFLFDRDGRTLDRLPFETVTNIGVYPEVISLLKALSAAWLLQDTGFQLTVRAYVELIISRLLDLAVYKNPSTVADSRIQQVLAYVTEHYARPISLQELSDLAQLSPTYLSALFHKNMGMKLSTYINIIRVNHAETMLMNNMCNVSEASELCGFCDVYYFSRVFTKLKGYNPHEIIGKRYPMR